MATFGGYKFAFARPDRGESKLVVDPPEPRPFEADDEDDAFAKLSVVDGVETAASLTSELLGSPATADALERVDTRTVCSGYIVADGEEVVVRMFEAQEYGGSPALYDLAFARLEEWARPRYRRIRRGRSLA